MGSKQKETVLRQKAYFETKLNKRRSCLAEKGLDPEMIAKDGIVKKIKSKIRETNAKHNAISEIERKKEELAKIKAKRLAVLKKEKEKKEKKPKDAAGKGKESKGNAPKESPEKGKEKKIKKKKASETDEQIME